LGRGRPGFPPRSPCRAVLTHHTTSGDAVPRTGLSPPVAGRSRPFRYAAPSGGPPHAAPCGGTTPRRLRACARWAAGVWAAAGSARRYSRPRACFFLLGLLRCFTSPACPRLASASGDAPHQRAGFPHSGTVGSPPARGLPHALGPSRPPFLGLRRLGHPPGALSNAGRALAPPARTMSKQPSRLDQSVQSSLVKPRSPGGDEGIRTPDIRLAKAALSQLSYVPRMPIGSRRRWACLDSNQGPRSYQDRALTT
jgi:hypothetical protein